MELLTEAKWINFIPGMVKNKDDIKALISLHKSKISSYGVKSLGLFGSYAKGSNTGGSDIDLLVSFDEDADWSLLEHVQMQFELQEMLGRKVDLVNKRALKRSQNWIRREEILRTASPIFTQKEVVYGAG